MPNNSNFSRNEFLCVTVLGLDVGGCTVFELAWKQYKLARSSSRMEVTFSFFFEVRIGLKRACRYNRKCDLF